LRWRTERFPIAVGSIRLVNPDPVTVLHGPGSTQMENVEQQNDSPNARRRPPTGRPSRKPLGPDEIEAAFRNAPLFPPILSLDQAAQLAHLAPGTVQRLVSEGYFGNSVRRGKPIAFWRDRFVAEAMELDRARERNKHAKLQKGAQHP
jgi:hypothetical protein